uniref:hypothetical protein n=1 Tax=Porphyridium aerugineum TaxID=2792 RepID=UPI001FCDAD9B|nr:hypothetical protein MW505_pgp179 [Porphyridium aerugineum]UNJ17818.1 hypothetical protein [Porphyridium aerugineum]
MTLLVIGATGTLGRQIVRKALQEGYQVRCLVRSVRQSAFLKEWGAQLIYGDLTIAETIPPALCGVTAVIDASTARPFDSYPTEFVDMLGKQNLLKAVEVAHIDRFVFFSLVNAHFYKNVPLINYKIKMEEYIKASKVNYTIFRLAGFYQGLINQYCVPILDQQPIWLTADSAPVGYMDTQDVAKFVIKSLSMPLAEKQSFDLTGNYAWNSKEIVNLCEVLSGQKAKIKRIPILLLSTLRKFTSLFEWTYNISDRLAFAEVLASGKQFIAPMSQTYEFFNIDSKEMVTLEKYLQDYFNKILKKIKDLNYDQRQKRNDIKF